MTDKQQTKTEARQALVKACIDAVKDETEFFHDADGMPWAHVPVNGHFENLPIKGPVFNLLVTRRLREMLGGMPSTKDVKDVIRDLEGHARFDGPERTLSLRVAEHKSDFYLDLGTPNWDIVRITNHGWTVETNVPVRFRRTQGMRSLPIPRQADTLPRGSRHMPLDREELFQYLFQFLNVTQRQHQVLVLSWLVSAFRPAGPYPILAFHGQQGAAKTTAQTILKKLIDPSSAPMRSAPKDERDLVISAQHSYVLGFDNFSHVSPWLSDALCRLVTGGGFATRQLYTDDTQVAFHGQRPIMLNGITDVAERGDLLDRMLVVGCSKIPAERRRPEQQLFSSFATCAPWMLGALLDVVSETLKKYPDVSQRRKELFPKLPRMADFAVWSVAAEEALGFHPGEFMDAYTRNREEVSLVALETSVTASHLVEWKKYQHTGDWQGTFKELYAALTKYVSAVPRGFPRNAIGLSNELKRAEPNLQAVGIVIEHLKREGGTGKRLIRIVDGSGEPADSDTNRGEICRAYRKIHPETAHETNTVVYKKATADAQFMVMFKHFRGPKYTAASASSAAPAKESVVPDAVPADAFPAACVSLYDPDFISAEDADSLFAELSTLPWQQHIIQRFGLPAPRMYQWMGIPPQPKAYSAGAFKKEGSVYTSEAFTPMKWTPAAREIQQRVFRATGLLFDSLNINYYRDENDHLGFHVDKQDEGLWEFPIASVSLGAERDFQLQGYKSDNPFGHSKRTGVGDIYTLTLGHGSLVVMPALSQAAYQHRLRKANKSCKPRINLTFRMMTPAKHTAASAT